MITQERMVQFEYLLLQILHFVKGYVTTNS